MVQSPARRLSTEAAGAATYMGKSGGDIAANGRITFPCNTPLGGISKMIKFTMATEMDRPWIAWYDEGARQRTALGYHSRDVASGDYHNAFEIKVSGPPDAANPLDMRTRFSLSTNDTVGIADFPSTRTLQVNRGVYAADESFGFTLRTPDSTGTSRKTAEIQTAMTAAGNTIMYLDVLTGGQADKTATLNIFRATATNVVSGAVLNIKRGDGSTTDAFVLNASRGWFTVANATAIPGAAPTDGGGYLYADAGALKWRGGSGTVTTIAPA